MVVRVVCRACGKRLKLPDGLQPKRAAKCPKCMTRVDLTAALTASAYLPTVTVTKPTGKSNTALAKPPEVSHPPITQEEPQEPLSLDDDLEPAGPLPPAVEPPFRVPVSVLADSFRQVAGACSAVFVPHGIFLEREALKPFLYFPVGSAVEVPASGELAIRLPDGRAVTLGFEVAYAIPLADDARAFLAGGRGVPVESDYRRTRWLFWLAVLAGMCAVGAGLFFFGTAAYNAGRQKGLDEAAVPVALAPVAPQPPVADASGSSTGPGTRRPPSHIDRAYQNGASALDDGPADVTALGIAPDGDTLGIGYADGTTRIWSLEQPTFEAMQLGPKADGQVSRIQFDSKSHFIIVTAASGVIVTPRNTILPAPAKIPGAFVAVAAEMPSDRFRFAAVRGNTVQQRLLPRAFVVSPPPKAKGFALTTPKDEVFPGANERDPAKPSGPTFLAWAPGNRLLAGAPDGAVTVWSSLMKQESVYREHRAAVKAWADCPGTGDFATGDDKGNIAIWPYKGGKPTVVPVFNVPVTGLSFSPSGAWLVVTDNSGWLAIYDIADAKVIHRVKRPNVVKSLAFGPHDDTLLLANGRTAEVWWLPELVR